ncbi:MAG: DUF4399 domain-containing protein [Alphaproteobacteria bacterium]|nr:MAG: DUF4399 domain-containing protein [Alphaproteobacteria bacterium]
MTTGITNLIAGLALGTGLFAGAALADDRTPAPEGAAVYFISPQDGDTVKGPVHVVFGLKGMGVAPAGTEKANTGHHHLIIDVDLPPFDENVPMDDQHRHFGGGQTETEVTLAPGTHTLQLLLADQNHIPHNPPVYSQKITITVTE